MNEDGLFPPMPHSPLPAPPTFHPVVWARCPSCHARERCGLFRVGMHLVWPEHHYLTWDGQHRVCATSGVAICTAPPKYATHTCPCLDIREDP